MTGNILHEHLCNGSDFRKKLRKDAGVDGEAAGQMESLRENEEILKRAVSTAESVDDIKAYIGTLLDHAIELRNTVSGRRYSDIIQTAKKRIEQDYMSEDISLNSVAAEVCMSPSYFSSVFSKEMGKTFIEYLTEVRMEKAETVSGLFIYENIGDQLEVGYKDRIILAIFSRNDPGLHCRKNTGRQERGKLCLDIRSFP